MSAKRDTGVVMGAVALAGAAMLFAVTVTRVTLNASDSSAPAVVSTADATPAASTPATPSAPAALLTAAPASAPATAKAVLPAMPEPLPSSALRQAVAKAPFAPDRKAPAQRYLLPEQIVVERPEAPPPERPAAPEFRVLGTVASATGGVAVVQSPDGTRRLLSVGQEIEGYRVRAIEQAAVVMSGQGWDMTFAVADATPSPGGGGNQNGRGQQGRAGQQGAAGVQAQRNAALNQVLQQLRGVEGAAAAAAAAAGQRGNVGFIFENGRGTFIGPNGTTFGDVMFTAPQGGAAVAGKVVGGDAATTWVVKPRPPGN